MKHKEAHRTHRIGWLRAAVLGANDGIVSTASLLVGVAVANVAPSTVVMTAVAVGASLLKAVAALVPANAILTWASVASLLSLTALGVVRVMELVKVIGLVGAKVARMAGRLI